MGGFVSLVFCSFHRGFLLFCLLGFCLFASVGWVANFYLLFLFVFLFLFLFFFLLTLYGLNVVMGEEGVS